MPDNMLLGFLALLVIFLIIAAVGYLQDEAKTRGTLALVGACGLGLFTAFYVYPRLGLDGNTVEVAKLKAELAQIKKDTVKLAQEREAFKSEASKTAQEKAALESQHGTQMTALLNELGQVRDRVRDPEVGVRISRQTAGAEETAATPPYERAMAQVRDLKTIEARSVPKSADPPADRADTTRELIQLKDRMATQMTTPNYDVSVYPDKEMIKGRTAKYYVVDLKNAASGIRYYFDGGKYTISRSLPEFRTSLNAFIKDVLAKLDGNVRYDLLVRGRADAKPWTGRFEANHEYRQIRFMRSAGGDRYISDLAEEKLDDKLTNENLPNLRAAFLRAIVAETYPVKPPLILEGAVSPKADDKDRNAEILLLVEW